MKRYGIILIFSLYSVFLKAQFYSTGPDPASLKWKQINTDHFQVIFPAEFQPEAIKTAHTLEYLYDHVSADYRRKPKKISIVLHNHSVVSNAYVSWAPRRSEWITTPPGESYAEDWLQLLVVHELRHVVQVTNLDQGLVRIAKVLFGEAAVGVTVGYLPLWYLEGDAVMAETAFSSAGRGRESEFDREIRAIELDRDKRFSYDQAFLGSYRYNIPDHYSYGYQMITFAQLKYGSNFWGQVLHQVAKTPYLLFPFYLGMKRGGDISKDQLYHQTFDTLKHFWNNIIDTSILGYNSNIEIAPSKSYVDYYHVQALNDGHFAVKSGLDDITRFIRLKDSGEEVICYPGYYPRTKISVGKRFVCWEEYRYDPRWDQRSFNVIVIYDLLTGKRKTVGKKERLYAPDLSHDEKRLVFFSVNLKNEYTIRITEIANGDLIQEIPLGNTGHMESTEWLDENHIAYVTYSGKGESIVRLNLENQQCDTLFSAGYTNIGYLRAAGHHLLFTYDKETARNIYALDLRDKRVYRMTDTRHGADFPAYDENLDQLIYSEYTPDGYRPVRISMDSILKVVETDINPQVYPWAEKISEKSPVNIQADTIPSFNYRVSPYRKIFHAFNFHSWAPFYINPYQVSDFSADIYPGLTLMSQNKLSTLTSLISYHYREGVHQVESRFIWEGIYPVFEARFIASTEPRFYSWPRDSAAPESPELDRRLVLESYLPLSFDRSRWRRYFEPSVGYSYFHRYYYSENGAGLGYDVMVGSVLMFNYRRQAYRDLQPRFGQALYLAYYQPLRAEDYFTPVFVGSFYQYLPGLFKHHGIRLGTSWDHRDPEKHPIFGNLVSLPRGYTASMLYTDHVRFTGEYSFPFLYPDWNLGPVFYLKRLHLTFFSDISRIKYFDEQNGPELQTKDLFSVGLILGGDVHFLRFFMPFEPRFRVAYLPGEKSLHFGFDMRLNTSVD